MHLNARVAMRWTTWQASLFGPHPGCGRLDLRWKVVAPLLELVNEAGSEVWRRKLNLKTEVESSRALYYTLAPSSEFQAVSTWVS